MGSPAAIQVTADSHRNILRVSFAGNITALDLLPYRAESANAVESLRSGFSLLVDLTDLASMGLECVPYIEQNMELFRDHGVNLVVRVIPDRSKDIGLGIISLFHYQRGLKILTVETRPEAESLLS